MNREVERRAHQTHGRSDAAIYRMVAEALASRSVGGDVLIDVGCGTGSLWPFVQHRFAKYVGVDAVRHSGFPSCASFHEVDLDNDRVALPDNCADVVVGAETIEHLENPRAYVRELARLARPGGWIVVTTPNQLSLLSLLTLFTRRRFGSFQDCDYPAHLTALLEVDLTRIAAECGLKAVGIEYSRRGRIPLMPWHYPEVLSCWFPRALSDNLLLIGCKV